MKSLLLVESFSTDTNSSELTFASHSTRQGFKSHMVTGHPE